MTTPPVVTRARTLMRIPAPERTRLARIARRGVEIFSKLRRNKDTERLLFTLYSGLEMALLDIAALEGRLAMAERRALVAETDLARRIQEEFEAVTVTRDTQELLPATVPTKQMAAQRPPGQRSR